MEQINEVYETYDYNQFKFIKGNRLIKTQHVNNIFKSMQKERLFSPLIVNEKMEIIDGQHRFKAQQMLKVSIPFIIKEGYGKRETQILNHNASNWTLDDALHTYCTDKIEDYLIFNEFKNTYKFANRECLNLLSGTKKTSYEDIFRAGKFKITDYPGAVEKAVKITQIAPYFEHYYRRNFVTAMLVCFDNNNYNHKQFLRKLEYQSTKLVKCVSEVAYLDLIENIYDYNNRRGTPKLRLY